MVTLRFIKPVFVRDTIYIIRTHLERWPKYINLGMVRVSYEVFKMPAYWLFIVNILQTVKYHDASKITQQKTNS